MGALGLHKGYVRLLLRKLSTCNFPRSTLSDLWFFREAMVFNYGTEAPRHYEETA